VGQFPSLTLRVGGSYTNPKRQRGKLTHYLNEGRSVEEIMADEKPKPKPEIPMGKLVTGKPEKPAVPKPKPRPPEPAPVTAARPPAAPVPPPAPADGFDVDLVAVPCPPPQPVTPRDQRGLFELDRRDFIMMGAGVGGSVIAVLAGLLMARTFSRKSDEKPQDLEKKPKTGE
jgi:hypothetical protein